VSALPAESLNTHAYWLTSRSAGIVAMGLLSLSVICGLLISGRLGKNRTYLFIHQASATVAVAVMALHGFILLGDGYLKPEVLDILLPFSGTYKPFWTGLGVLGGWIAVLLGLSFYIRKFIGPTVWLKLHRFVIIAWVLATVHSFGAGSDIKTTPMWVFMILQVSLVVMFFISRVLPRKKKPTRSTKLNRSIA